MLLVERGPAVGGWAATYGCKAGDDCSLCGVCLSARALRSPALCAGSPITLKVDTTVVEIEGGPGKLTARLVSQGRGVDVARCTACGLCTGICPEGAVIAPHPQAVPQSYAIDRSRCVRAAGEECRLCEEACPFGAVDLEFERREESVKAGVVVVASGFRPFDAAAKGQYGYGRRPGVITTMEMEQGLWLHGPAYIDQVLGGGRRVAFVHCVGSRDNAIGRVWCSQLCCPTVLRLAHRLASADAALQISLFYMDLQRCAPGIPDLVRTLPANVALMRGMPAEILSVPGGLSLAYEDLTLAERREAEFDLVVLAVGMEGPAPIVGLDGEVGRFLALAGPGVITAGACGGPQAIPEAVADGLRAAGEAIALLEAGR